MKKDEERAMMVAIAMAHEAWDCCDEEEHDRWVAIAERATDGTMTEEDWCEVREADEEGIERYEDEDWCDLG